VFEDTHESLEACVSSCAELEGAARDSGYVLADARSGDTVQCRIYHATLAVSDQDQCAAVFGGAPCDE
jgi:hypothetical protein